MKGNERDMRLISGLSEAVRLSSSPRGLAYLLHLHRRGRFLERARELREAWRSVESVEAYQKQRLGVLLGHAARNTRHYGAALKADATPGALRRLPILSRADLQSHARDLTSADLATRAWWETLSGGSTGEPVKVIQDATYQEYVVANKFLLEFEAGIRLGDRRLYVWGSDRDIFEGGESRRVRLGRWLRNETWINAFRQASDPASMVEEFRRARPHFVIGYVEHLLHIARALREQPKPKHLSVVMATAGSLLPQMYETMVEGFRVPVLNRYGSREVGDVACSCGKSEYLHVQWPTHHVEIVDDAGEPCEPGKIGRILVTPLFNFAMPLLRYEIGDVGAWADEPCPCGRPGACLKSVNGRTTDIFYNAKGEAIYGFFFTTLIFGQDGVRRFRVIQESEQKIQVLIEPASGWQSETLAVSLSSIPAKIRTLMGPDVSVDIDFVDYIPPLPSGKYHYTISHVRR